MMEENIINEQFIEVVDENGNKYTARVKDLKVASEIETKSKRGPKFWGRVAKTFKEIPERMNKWYENTVGKAKETRNVKSQNRKDKKFVEKSIEEMEKDIAANRNQLNDLIKREIEILVEELKTTNIEIDNHTQEIKKVQEEEVKREKEDEQYYYYSSELKRVNQELSELDKNLKSKLAEFKEKQEKALTNPDLRDELVSLEREIYKFMGAKKGLETEKQSLEQDKDSYLKEHELTDNISHINKLGLARFDLNEKASKLNDELRTIRSITLDNIDIMLPNIHNIKIQKLYQELQRKESIMNMKIKEQEEIAKSLKIGDFKSNVPDVQLEDLEDVTSAVIDQITGDIGAAVSAINSQNVDADSTSTIETVSSNADASLQFDEPLQFNDDSILKKVNIPPFNPEDTSQSQSIESNEDVQHSVAEVVAEPVVAMETPSEEPVSVQEATSEEPNIDNSVPREHGINTDINIETLSWDDYANTDDAKKIAEKLKKTLTGFAEETINIISTMFEEERKHNEAQLGQVNAVYQGLVSENNTLKHELEEAKDKNNSLMQENASLTNNIKDNYTPNEFVEELRVEHVKSLNEKDEAISAVQTENQTLRQQLSASQNENATLNDDINVKNQKINDLEQGNSDKDQEIQTLRSDIKKLTQTIESLSFENQNLQRKIDAIYAVFQSQTSYAEPMAAEYQPQPEAAVAEAPRKK